LISHHSFILHAAFLYAIKVYQKRIASKEKIMADAKTKTVNYTDEMVERMIARYQELGNDGMETLAEEMNRSVRSVRSKLVREGVYIATLKAPAAPKDTGPSKKELLNQLEDVVGFDVTPLQGATKEGIQALIAFARAKEQAA
jgi:hypothetical protein